MTLIELLSAMVVFSVVVGMFALILSSAIRHSDEIDEQTNLQVQARSALGFVSSDLRQAYDGDGDPATAPIETMTATQLTFLSPDRQSPFHMRRLISPCNLLTAFAREARRRARTVMQKSPLCAAARPRARNSRCH